MTLQEIKTTINTGIKQSMIAKDTIKLETLRSINNALVNAEKNNPGKDINPVDVIGTLAKQRQQSIDAFTKGGNTELADKEKSELTILEEFLPKKMSDADVVLALNEVIMEMSPVPTIKEMGKVIAAFKAKYPGQDMGKITGMIKTILPAG